MEKRKGKEKISYFVFVYAVFVYAFYIKLKELGTQFPAMMFFFFSFFLLFFYLSLSFSKNSSIASLTLLTAVMRSSSESDLSKLNIVMQGPNPVWHLP